MIKVASLYQHPKITEVAVIGICDSKWGEAVKAIVSLKAGFSMEGELDEFCHTKLARFKNPRYIEFVDALPKNPVGKILKKEIRKLYGKQHT